MLNLKHFHWIHPCFKPSGSLGLAWAWVVARQRYLCCSVWTGTEHGKKFETFPCSNSCLLLWFFSEDSVWPQADYHKRYLAHVAVACILVTSMHISHSYSSSRLLRLVVKNSSSLVAVAVWYELRAQYLHPPPYRGGVMGWLKPHLKCSA